MIAAVVSDKTFSYEIHSLVKAFYPDDEVKVFACDEAIPEDAARHIYDGLPKERDALKRALYQRLCEETKRELPWGTLTGIRPTRIAFQYLYQGMPEERIAAHFKENYFTSNEKINLAIAIAKRERDVLAGIDYRNGYSLYIGIPFCPTTCAYCSFASYPLAQFGTLRDAYVDALIKELDYVAGAFQGRPIHSIYIGGGTPTTLTVPQMERLLHAVTTKLELSQMKELTVESGRPDSLNDELLRCMRAYPVNRICVNPQTMKEETLRLIGRAHTVDDTLRAYHAARKAGFSEINMDIILGLPEETAADVAHTMDVLCDLNPDDITVHSLAVKRGSRMHRALTQGEQVSFASDAEEMMHVTLNKAEGIGCTPYYLYRQKNMTGNLENTGLAKEGKEGLYNILINEELQSIVAIGCGSVSKRVFYIEETQGDGTTPQLHTRIERCDAVKDLSLYLSDVDGMIARKEALFSN